MEKFSRSGFTLAAVLGAAVLWQGTARACSEPDTGTKAGKTFPFVTEDSPYYWDPNAAGPAGGAGNPTAAPGPADPRTPNEREAVLISFGAGNDRDSDPNVDYFKHAHRAYTVVTVSDVKTGTVVLTERVPVWDYGAIDRGAMRQGDKFKRIEAMRLQPLPAGQYQVKTQALFVHPDGKVSSAWGASTLEGPVASATFAIAPSADPAPASGNGNGNVLVGEGCQGAPGSHSQLGWLALGGLFVLAARRRSAR